MKAYLLGCLDTTLFNPIVKCVGIYSSSNITCHLNKEHYFTILYAEGSSYQEAIDNLAAILSKNPTLDWIFPLLVFSAKQNLQNTNHCNELVARGL